MEMVIQNKQGEYIPKMVDHSVYLVENAQKDFVYKIKKTDTLETLKKKFGDLDFGYIYAGKCIYIASTNALKYVVKPLDTLTKICEKFHVEKESIISINNLKTERLFVGQKLKIE